VELEKGDVLLLCTDGLTKHVGDEAIAKTLTGRITAPQVNARTLAQKLVEMANEKGGTDNITAVIARFS
jgi:protein phosphatase